MNIKRLGIMEQKVISIQDLCLYMPYLQALLSESVKLMFHSMSQAWCYMSGLNTLDI